MNDVVATVRRNTALRARAQLTALSEPALTDADLEDVLEVLERHNDGVGAPAPADADGWELAFTAERHARLDAKVRVARFGAVTMAREWAYQHGIAVPEDDDAAIATLKGALAAIVDDNADTLAKVDQDIADATR